MSTKMLLAIVVDVLRVLERFLWSSSSSSSSSSPSLSHYKDDSYYEREHLLRVRLHGSTPCSIFVCFFCSWTIGNLQISNKKKSKSDRHKKSKKSTRATDKVTFRVTCTRLKIFGFDFRWELLSMFARYEVMYVMPKQHEITPFFIKAPWFGSSWGDQRTNHKRGSSNHFSLRVFGIVDFPAINLNLLKLPKSIGVGKNWLKPWRDIIIPFKSRVFFNMYR